MWNWLHNENDDDNDNEGPLMYVWAPCEIWPFTTIPSPSSPKPLGQTFGSATQFNYSNSLTEKVHGNPQR